MMQIMPGTAQSLGLNNPFDPIANMRAGARYLHQQIERFGRIDLALAAYNAGPEWRSLTVGYVPAIPETVRYVQTISRNWARLAAAPPANDLPVQRAIAASNAVLLLDIAALSFPVCRDECRKADIVRI
jgi:soluble lytic murein transglycosylase-like protein